MAEMHPKRMLCDSEVCFGVPHEDARRLAGLDEHMPSEGGEVGGYSKGGQVLNALRRINARLKLLRRTRFAGGEDWADGANRRTCRATEELLWVKGLLENGGIEPDEWGDNGE